MLAAPNRNLLWAKTFVDELARCGLETVSIAPGSRSTPLVIAFAENPRIRVYSHIDERSAAFFALGHALATDRPVALVCSSGTAAANFYPAVIEARYSHVPLLVLTADRQHELRDSGANQTIDQVKLYGDHVLWFYDVALPEGDPPAVAVRNLRTLADRAYATANGLAKGVVHLNFPFRKPLEPTPVETDHTDVEPYDAAEPFTQISRGVLQPTGAQLEQLSNLIGGAQRGMIICGPRTPVDLPLGRLQAATGFPILADVLSNARFLYAADGTEIIAAYETFLAGEAPFEPPDLLLHFGAMPASAALEAYLNRISPSNRILISGTGGWTDPYHRLTHLVHADPAAVCAALIERGLSSRIDHDWASQVAAVSRATWRALKEAAADTLFDGAAVAAAVEACAFDPATRVNLFLASSLAVRHAEQYLPPDYDAYRVYANRGASGIDGTISSAFGVAAADPNRPTLLITGDLAFYHDMNGLLALKRCGIDNLTIVLINNDGGGIFHRLPIHHFDPPFTDLFVTPHGLDFEPAVRMYGFDYVRADTLDALRTAVGESVQGRTPAVIEVRTDARQDLERRADITQRVLETLKQRTAS